jgi:hypothetical protein
MRPWWAISNFESTTGALHLCYASEFFTEPFSLIRGNKYSQRANRQIGLKHSDSLQNLTKTTVVCKINSLAQLPLPQVTQFPQAVDGQRDPRLS